MSAGSVVIKEFLASVGFKADEKSLKASLTKVAAFGVAIQTVALGIYAGITKVAAGEAQLARQAEKLGTTSDKLQELGYVAEQSGSSLDAVTRSMEGLVAKNPRIKDAAKALEMAGERMSRMNDMQKKAYAARMGIDPSLIPALTKDARALKDEFRQMYAVAGIDAKKAGEASKGFMAELGKLATMAGLLSKGLALAFMEKARDGIENLRRVLFENIGAIKRVFETLISVVLRISGVISAFAYRVIKWVGALVQWYDKLDGGQKKLILGVGLLLAAWKLLNAGFLATPLGMIVAGLTAVVALVDDYLTYMEGGESYFDWGPWAGTINDVVQALKPVLGVVMGIGQGIMAAVVPAFQGIISTIGRVIEHFRLLGNFVKAVFSGDFAGAVEAGKAILGNLADMVNGIFSGLVETIRSFFTALWPSVQENFPDFAAWAEESAAAITGLFGSAIQWVKDKLNALIGYLPDWVKEKMGFSVDGDDKPDPPPPGGPPPYSDIRRTALAAKATQGPALTPSPAQAAGMSQTTQQNVQLNAKTEITVNGAGDPVAVGNQVAGRQNQVNADLVRHTKVKAK